MARRRPPRPIFTIHGARRPVRTLLIGFVGFCASMLAVSAIDAIDATNEAKHYTGEQNLINNVAVVTGLIGATVVVVWVVHRLRLRAATGRPDVVIVRGRHRIPVAYAMIRRVVLVPLRGGRRHAPALELVNGQTVVLARARSRNATPTTEVVAIDPNGEPAKRDFAARQARRLVEHVTALVPAPSPAVATAPADVLAFSTPFTSAAPGGFVTSDGPPSGAVVRVGEREVANPLALLYTQIPVALAVSFFSALRFQDGTDHPTNWTQVAEVAGSIFAVFFVLVVLAYRVMVTDLAVGPDWVATRRRWSKTWVTARRDSIVAVRAVVSKGRNRRTMTYVRYSDAEGHSVSLAQTWLTPAARPALETAFGDSRAVTPDAAGLLGPAPDPGVVAPLEIPLAD